MLQPRPKVLALGIPWHGLVIGQTLQLPNGGTKLLPRQPNGNSQLLAKGLNAPVGPITTPLDAEKGYQWKDRLVFDRKLFGMTNKDVIYQDPNGAAWQLRIRAYITSTTFRCTAELYKRFGYLPQDPAGPPTVPVVVFYDSGVIDVSAELADIGAASLRTISGSVDYDWLSQHPDGSSVLVHVPLISPSAGELVPADMAGERDLFKVYRLDISGTPDPDAGYAGLAGALSVHRTAQQCAPLATVSEAHNMYQPFDLQGEHQVRTTSTGADVVGTITSTHPDLPLQHDVSLTVDDVTPSTTKVATPLVWADVSTNLMSGTYVHDTTQTALTKCYFDEDGLIHEIGVRYRHKLDVTASHTMTSTYSFTVTRNITVEVPGESVRFAESFGDNGWSITQSGSTHWVEFVEKAVTIDGLDVSAFRNEITRDQSWSNSIDDITPAYSTSQVVPDSSGVSVNWKHEDVYGLPRDEDPSIFYDSWGDILPERFGRTYHIDPGYAFPGDPASIINLGEWDVVSDTKVQIRDGSSVTPDASFDETALGGGIVILGTRIGCYSLGGVKYGKYTSGASLPGDTKAYAAYDYYSGSISSDDVVINHI